MKSKCFKCNKNIFCGGIRRVESLEQKTHYLPDYVTIKINCSKFEPMNNE